MRKKIKILINGKVLLQYYKGVGKVFHNLCFTYEFSFLFIYLFSCPIRFYSEPLYLFSYFPYYHSTLLFFYLSLFFLDVTDQLVERGKMIFSFISRFQNKRKKEMIKQLHPFPIRSCIISQKNEFSRLFLIESELC